MYMALGCLGTLLILICCCFGVCINNCREARKAKHIPEDINKVGTIAGGKY